MPRRARTTPKRPLARLPLAAAIYLAFGSLAWAQDAATPQQPPATDTGHTDAGQQPPQSTTSSASASKKPAQLEAVVVTAQKRTENLQKVPISMQAISQTKLTQQDVHSFDDYVKLLPSVTFGTAGGGVFSGPGFVQVYMAALRRGTPGAYASRADGRRAISAA